MISCVLKHSWSSRVHRQRTSLSPSDVSLFPASQCNTDNRLITQRFPILYALLYEKLKEFDSSVLCDYLTLFDLS